MNCPKESPLLDGWINHRRTPPPNGVYMVFEHWMPEGDPGVLMRFEDGKWFRLTEEQKDATLGVCCYSLTAVEPIAAVAK